MADFLTSLGRANQPLTRASQNILNVAALIRQANRDDQELALKSRELNLKTRQAGIEEVRASEVHGLNVRQRTIDINIAENKLEAFEDEQKINAKPVEMATIQKAMNNPRQFQQDYTEAKKLGLVDKFSNGQEYMSVGNLKWFKKNIQDTPIYRQSFAHNNLVRYTAEVDQLQGKLEEFIAPLKEKKTDKEIGEMPEVKQILQALTVAAQGKATSMANDAGLSELMRKMIGEYGMDATEEWRRTGDTSQLQKPISATGKLSDFERAYQQHIALPGNAAVTRAEFKTGPFSIPKGELTDDAVLRHFTAIGLENLAGVTSTQAMMQRFTDNMAKNMSRIDAFNEAKEWGLRKLSGDPEDTTDVSEFDSLFLDSDNDNLFKVHE